MRQILIFLFLLTAFNSFGQFGVKAGYIYPSGVQAGIMGSVQLNEGSSGFFTVEGMIQNYTEKTENGSLTDENGNPIKPFLVENRNTYFHIPLILRIEFSKKVKPFVSLGAAPTFGVSTLARNFDVRGQFGGGLRIKDFITEARFNYGFQGVKTDTNTKNWTFSVGYFF